MLYYCLGLIGVNLWPQEPNRRYLLCPRSMFCEFLPESSLEDETPQTLLMEEVKEGHNYELVITNASGLFRSVHWQENLFFPRKTVRILLMIFIAALL